MHTYILTFTYIGYAFHGFGKGVAFVTAVMYWMSNLIGNCAFILLLFSSLGLTFLYIICMYAYIYIHVCVVHITYTSVGCAPSIVIVIVVIFEVL